MTQYLVTGGAGFIGSHISTALIERGDRVRVLDDFSSGKLENLAHLETGELGSAAPLEIVRGDVASSADCARACVGVHGIFHQAAQVSVPQSIEDPEGSYRINVTGTLQVLQAARAAGVERVVFAASAAAYGESTELPKIETMRPDPRSPYASGKVAAEHLMRVFGECYGLRTACLRYFNVFGPRQADDSPYTGVIAIFARALLEERRPTIFGDGGQTRDFTYVGNAVRANLAAVEADLEPGAVVNIGGGARVSLLELYSAMGEILGVELEPHFEPVRGGDVRHSEASLERAAAWLGYRPEVTWREGLETTLAWYRERFQPAR